MIILEGGGPTSIGYLATPPFTLAKSQRSFHECIAMPLRDGVVGSEKGRAMIKYSVICEQAAMILK